MSNSTTLLDQISSAQANKEAVANALFDAASPAMLWGRQASTCSGLTWGYFGGNFQIGSTSNPVASGTVTLTASATNYVYANATTGAVSANTTGFPAGAVPLYQIVTGTTTVTSYTDVRSYQPSAVTPGSPSLQSLSDVNVTEGAGIANYVLRWDQPTGKWVADVRPYDLLMFAPGVPVAGALMARVVVPRAVTFPAGLAGSFASTPSGNGATTAAALTIAKNGSSIGTINFAAGATSATFTFSSAVTTVAGDVITITNQSPADATLANISMTLVGAR